MRNIILLLFSLLFACTSAVSANNKVPQIAFSAKEIVNEVHYWNNHLIIVSNNASGKKIVVTCSDIEGNIKWKNEIPYKPADMESFDQTILLNDDSFYLLHNVRAKSEIYTFTINGLQNKATRQSGKENISRKLGIEVTGKGYKVFHANSVFKSNRNFGYFVTEFSENGTASNSIKLDLPAFKSGDWYYNGKLNNDYYFSGSEQGYTSGGGVDVIFRTLDDNGKSVKSFTYTIELENNKFPVPAWEGEAGVIGQFANVYLSKEENAFYVYGVFQTKKKTHTTGLAATKLQQEGAFIHKITSEGKVIYKKQHYFKDHGISLSVQNKEVLLEVSPFTKEMVFGVLEYYDLNKRYKSFSLIVDKTQGEVMEAFAGRDYDNWKPDFYSTTNNIKYNANLGNNQALLSSLYKGFNGKSRISWVANLIDVSAKIPSKQYFSAHRFFIFHTENKTIMVQFDNSVNDKPVVRIFA